MNCEEIWRKYSIVRTLPPDRRHHCPHCGVLLLESDLVQHDRGHSTRSIVTDEQLLEPTHLVTPKDNKKSQAVRINIKFISILLFKLLKCFYSNITSLIHLCNFYVLNYSD